MVFCPHPALFCLHTACDLATLHWGLGDQEVDGTYDGGNDNKDTADDQLDKLRSVGSSWVRRTLISLMEY
jgi:hypothetical protein